MAHPEGTDYRPAGRAPRAAFAPVVSLEAAVLETASPYFLGAVPEPAQEGVVIMCACKCDAVAVVVMRQICAVVTGIKCELHYPHAGDAGIGKELLKVGSPFAQVFGNEPFPAAELLVDLLEEFKAGAFDPLAFLGRIGVGIDFPVGTESPEMIDP